MSRPACSRRAQRAPALIALLALGSAACAAPEGRASDAAAAARPAHTHDVDASAAVAKPTAPISIAHRWLAPPAVGAALALRLEIGSERRLDDVVVELDGGRSLVVDAGSQSVRVPEIEAGATHAFEPAVFAAESGTHYLAVSVTAEIAGARQTRSVTIPVRLGGAATEREADAAKSGERVRSLPVEESTGRR